MVHELFERIEDEKQNDKEKFIQGVDDESEKSSYTSYASYYILYFLGELAIKSGVELDYNNIDLLWNLRPNALNLIEKLILKEKEILKKKDDKYSHVTFFKYNRPKSYLRIFQMKSYKLFG